MTGEPVDEAREDASLEIDGPLAVLRLCRPAVHNVVRMATIERLEVLLSELDAADEVKVLVLTGSGDKTFCAGSDLLELSKVEDRSAALEMSPRMHRILDRLEKGPQVVIAALNGSAYGGGCELLTACHLRLAPTTARFSFRQASLGLTTGWGGGLRLFRLLGRSAALRLLLTADTVGAQEALDLGLVDVVVPPQEVEPAALELARRIAAHPASSLQGFLALAEAASGLPPEEAAATERRLFAERWHGETFWRQVDAWKRRREGGR